MAILLLAPLFVQGILMMVDEFYFHHQRGLPKWEVFGHPLDTITVATPLAIAYFADFSDELVTPYALLSLFSCIFVVKDELVHKDLCSRGEMLLHALLFILHPLVFLSVFYLWQNQSVFLFGISIAHTSIIGGQLLMTVLFLVYQLIYWGLLNGSLHQQRNLQRARREMV